ncbi:MAG: DUF3300 domain-containing protein, partial [Pseudolabrys sp.]
AQVLAMMNEKLDWTNQLGEAFLAQPDDVQNAIQALRKQAEVTGNLKSSKEQKVSSVPAPTSGYAGPPEYIAIEPMEPDYIYVPVYDPVVVYGPTYWAPAYVPFFWHPPWWTVGPAFGFGAALFVGPALWYHYNWGHGGFAAIQTNTVLYSKFNKVNFSGGGQFQNWKFDPAHHGNVQFKNVKLQQQFGNQAGKNIQGIQGAKAIQGIQGTQGLQGKGVQVSRRTKRFRISRAARVSRKTRASRESKPTKTSRAFRPATRTSKPAEATKALGWSPASKFIRSVPAVAVNAPRSRGEAASPRTGAPIDRAAPQRFFKDEARARVTRAF